MKTNLRKQQEKHLSKILLPFWMKCAPENTTKNQHQDQDQDLAEVYASLRSNFNATSW